MNQKSSDSLLITTAAAVFLELYDILCSRTFLAIDNFKTYTLSLGQRFKTLCLNSGMMHEYILTSILFDKAKSFRIIKPLYCSFCHYSYSCVLGPALSLFS